VTIPIAHLVPIAVSPNVHIIGSLPQIFDRDRQQADAFINELLIYICVNTGVPGFESPMRKIAMALTYSASKNLSNVLNILIVL